MPDPQEKKQEPEKKVEPTPPVEPSFPTSGIAVMEFECPPTLGVCKEGTKVDKPMDMPQETWEGLFKSCLKHA